MRGSLLIAATLLAAGCNSSPEDRAVAQMKQQVLMMLREHRTAEFADIRPCPTGQGYSGTIRAGNGNGGTGGPFPFIALGTMISINQDGVPDDQRIQAGSYQSGIGRYERLRPRCFGDAPPADYGSGNIS